MNLPILLIGHRAGIHTYEIGPYPYNNVLKSSMFLYWWIICDKYWIQLMADAVAHQQRNLTWVYIYLDFNSLKKKTAKPIDRGRKRDTTKKKKVQFRDTNTTKTTNDIHGKSRMSVLFSLGRYTRIRQLSTFIFHRFHLKLFQSICNTVTPLLHVDVKVFYDYSIYIMLSMNWNPLTKK